MLEEVKKFHQLPVGEKLNYFEGTTLDVPFSLKQEFFKLYEQGKAILVQKVTSRTNNISTTRYIAIKKGE